MLAQRSCRFPGNLLNKKHMDMEHTLSHELLHMYDYAVFNVDWNIL
jgi:hypothetical protein